ncbi:hypothetical protein AGR3A_Lc200006 [Agrobacterium tomkonis CFBP 6623]|uniref:Uncharacterized protein n=1 Tax=Agrobacterium tomkonis CFBP 6623 TaxID=1183432 RepID=A0A1S7S4C1_9HYPH|nr:hypothetical protein AGR3A_Lc200006 [Agrobacterium tomkonis CFBP 6623]
MLILLDPRPIAGFFWGFCLRSCAPPLVAVMLDPLDRSNVRVGEDVENAIAQVKCPQYAEKGIERAVPASLQPLDAR